MLAWLHRRITDCVHAYTLQDLLSVVWYSMDILVLNSLIQIHSWVRGWSLYNLDFLASNCKLLGVHFWILRSISAADLTSMFFFFRTLQDQFELHGIFRQVVEQPKPGNC